MDRFHVSYGCQSGMILFLEQLPFIKCLSSKWFSLYYYMYLVKFYSYALYLSALALFNLSTRKIISEKNAFTLFTICIWSLPKFHNYFWFRETCHLHYYCSKSFFKPLYFIHTHGYKLWDVYNSSREMPNFLIVLSKKGSCHRLKQNKLYKYWLSIKTNYRPLKNTTRIPS